MKVPKRVRDCTTHHHACVCREWIHEHQLLALRIVRTYAAVNLDGRWEPQEDTLRAILDKCDEAINLEK